MARLKDVQILYFSPAAGWRDQAFRTQGRAVKPNVTTYTLPPLLLPMDERFGELFQLGQRKLARFIAAKMAKHRFRAPLLWTTCPEQVHLLDRLDYDGLVYDCDREWNDLSPAWRESWPPPPTWCSPPLRGWPTGSPLQQQHRPAAQRTAYPLFSKAAQAPQAHLPQREAPLLGWVGTVHSDLDLSPLLYTARARPEWYFLLLGRRNQIRWQKAGSAAQRALSAPCPQMELPAISSSARC